MTSYPDTQYQISQYPVSGIKLKMTVDAIPSLSFHFEQLKKFPACCAYLLMRLANFLFTTAIHDASSANKSGRFSLVR